MGIALTTAGFLDASQSSADLPPLQAAVRERPEDFRAVYALGLCLYRTRSYFLAEHAFRQAIELRYTNFEAHYYLALSLEAQRKAEQAAAEYRTAARLTREGQSRPDLEGSEAA